MYSEKELATYTEFLGMNIPISYEYDTEKLGDYYYTSLAEIRKQSKIVTTASDKPIQYKNLSKFLLGFGGALNSFKVQGNDHIEGYFAAYKNGITAQTIFDGSRMTSGDWTIIRKNAGLATK